MATATAERSKLELLRAREAELAIAVDEARARIALYPEQLHEARSRAIYAKPNVRPGAEINGEVAKITAKERKEVASLNGLQGDLGAVRSLIVTEAARVHEEETAEARKRLEQLHEQEEGVWTKAGEVFGELASVWNKYVALAEESSKFAYESGLDGPGVLAVEPAPMSFRSFLLLLHTASTDEAVRAQPFIEQLSETGIFGRRDEQGNDIGGAFYDTRPAGTRTVETRRRLDDQDRLYRLIPDLRSVVHRSQLSGRVPTIAE
jgi:hypothetical protein